ILNSNGLSAVDCPPRRRLSAGYPFPACSQATFEKRNFATGQRACARISKREQYQRNKLQEERHVAVERIRYQAGNVTGHGALVYDEKVKGRGPLLLVSPNWLGVTENAIKRAAKIAGDKYIAFVACMYGGGKTCAGPPESQEWMMKVRADRVEGRK